MSGVLPGSNSGVSWGVATTKAAVRLLGGQDLADAVADLAGLDRLSVRQLAAAASEALSPGVDHEFSENEAATAGSAAEALVIDLFTQLAASINPADRRSFAAAALMGSEGLVQLVMGGLEDTRLDGWSQAEVAWLDALLRRTCELTVEWYFEKANPRSFAVAAGVSQLLEESSSNSRRLSSLEVGVEELGRRGLATSVAVLLDPAQASLPHLMRFVQWIRWTLVERGFPVIPGPPTADPDELCLVVGDLKRAPVAEAPSSPQGSGGLRMLVVSFDDEGRLSMSGRTAEARDAGQLLVDVVGPLVQGRVRMGIDGLVYDTANELHRLRRLSDQALRDAGTVGRHALPSSEGAPGLYVRRDLEERVLSALDERPLVVVAGPAGVGKTSLLWGLAQRLVRDPGPDVYFLKASFLIDDAQRPPLVAAAALASAIRGRALECEAVVLIDTADLLVNDARSLDTLTSLVATVIAAGGRIVMTSRPAEAQVITAGADAPLVLGNFSTAASAPGTEPEFARAVRAHSIAYCTTPGDTGELAQQLLVAAVRGTPAAELARHPLSLRLLFELYAPGLVAPEISATSLFELFWENRVRRDRRSWVPAVADDRDDRDLSSSCVALAAQMLRTGMPEADVGRAVRSAPVAGASLDAAELLCARGVGSLTEQGRFRFFHQAFFEYVAARWFASLPGGLAVIAERTEVRPDDYFLAPVLEQCWVLTWQDPQRVGEASTLAVEHLARRSARQHRQVLRVLAQVHVPDAIAERLRVEFAEAELDVVKEYLRLLPPPGLAWQQIDSELLVLAHGRASGAAMAAVFDVLIRLARGDVGTARTATEDVATNSPVPLLSELSLGRREPIELLRLLVRYDAQWTLGFLTRAGIGSGAVSARLERVLAALRDCRPQDAPDVARWAEDVLGTRNASNRSLVEAMRHLYVAALGRAPDPGLLVGEFRSRIDAAESRDKVTARNMAFCWAVLDVLTKAGDDAALAEAISFIGLRPEPWLHEQVHHGWLVHPVNNSAVARAACADALHHGLPASHRSPADGPQRWADTVRRLLGRSDVDPRALRDVLSEHGLRSEENSLPGDPWGDDQRLAWLLLIAANAGHGDAMAAVRRWAAGTLVMPAATERIVAQQGQHITAPGPGTDLVLQTLLARHAHVELLQLMQRLPDLVWPKSATAALGAGLLVDSCTGDTPRRAQALRLLTAAVDRGVLPPPSWPGLRGLLKTKQRALRIAASRLLVGGLERRAYGPTAVWGQLEAWLDDDPTLYEVRRQLVRARAAAGDVASIATTTDLAFAAPVEAGTVIELAGYLNRNEMLGPPLPIAASLSLILEVGRRLADPTIPGRTRNDVPGAWRDMMGQILNRATDAQLVEVVRAIPTLGSVFAERLLDRLPARGDPAVKAALNAMTTDDRVVAQVVRVAEQQMSRAAAPAVHDWPDLDVLVSGLGPPET